jgi:hypothetical protein
MVGGGRPSCQGAGWRFGAGFPTNRRREAASCSGSRSSAARPRSPRRVVAGNRRFASDGRRSPWRSMRPLAYLDAGDRRRVQPPITKSLAARSRRCPTPCTGSRRRARGRRRQRATGGRARALCGPLQSSGTSSEAPGPCTACWTEPRPSRAATTAPASTSRPPWSGMRHWTPSPCSPALAVTTKRSCSTARVRTAATPRTPARRRRHGQAPQECSASPCACGESQDRNRAPARSPRWSCS